MGQVRSRRRRLAPEPQNAATGETVQIAPAPKSRGQRLLEALPEAVAILAGGFNPQAGQAALASIQNQRAEAQRQQDQERQRQQQVFNQQYQNRINAAQIGLQAAEDQDRAIREQQKADEDRALRAKQEQDRIEEERAKLNKPQYISTPRGIFDSSTRSIIPGTEPEKKADTARNKSIAEEASKLSAGGIKGDRAFDLASKVIDGTATPAEQAEYGTGQSAYFKRLHEGPDSGGSGSAKDTGAPGFTSSKRMQAYNLAVRGFENDKNLLDNEIAAAAGRGLRNPDADPKVAAIRKRVQARAESIATNYGDIAEVGLGKFPYVKLKNGGGGTAQSTATPAPSATQPKVVTQAQVQAVAASKGWTYDQAVQKAKAEGFTIQ